MLRAQLPEGGLMLAGVEQRRRWQREADMSTERKIPPEEQWVAAIVSRAIDRPVKLHDDNSEPSMYDLHIGDFRPGGAALEVTAVADPALSALWNTLHKTDGRWVFEGLAGGWTVEVPPTASTRKLRSELRDLLADLERRGIKEVDSDDAPWRPEVAKLHDLKISHLSQYDTDCPGSVYFMPDQGPERSGGAMAADAEDLLDWIEQLLASDAFMDNRQKLAKAATQDRHLFVLFPALATAPFSVHSALLGRNVALPSRAPRLPEEVTHLWLASTLGFPGDGIRWDGSAWHKFSIQPPPDEPASHSAN